MIDIADIRKDLPKEEFKLVKIIGSHDGFCTEEKDIVAIRTKMEIAAMRLAGVKFEILEY